MTENFSHLRGEQRVPIWGQALALSVSVAWALVAEAWRWSDPESRHEALSGWLAGVSADWLPFLPILVLLPVCYHGFRSRCPDPASAIGSSSLRVPGPGWLTRKPSDSGALAAWPGALFVFMLGGLLSWWSGRNFGGLPPAYHDEYSYLFQTQTYLAGRLWFPSFEPRPELFDQMHVLNEGKFASRYFPGVGAWIAPFLASGDPWRGHQLAQAFVSMMVFWTGRELANNGVGLLAGMLVALSSGMILFSNLLLAHHPTLVGLTLFLWSYLWGRRTGHTAMLILAGFGLSYAMLCRPMTAAGFGLPFGIEFLYWWIAGKESTTRRTLSAVWLGIPILIGFLVVFYTNAQITGSAGTTPYQLYTETYTPRHVYGFNNVVRGEQHLGPKVIDNYDRWAENLTPRLAVRNVRQRMVNSLRWTLGVIPLTLAGIVCLASCSMGDRRWKWVLASIVSVHAVHVPYWFEGIMGWHYVFETAPLWLLVMAESTRRLCVSWRRTGRPAMPWCWAALIGVAVMVNLVTVRPVWPARLDRAVAEVQFPRERYAAFRQEIDVLRAGRPAIVFVIPDPADRSMDYVTNPPDLTGPVLVARIPDRDHLRSAAKLFPDRQAFLFDALARRFEEIE